MNPYWLHPPGSPVPGWLKVSRAEFAQEVGIPEALVTKALAEEEVGALSAIQEAKIRAALMVIASSIREAVDRVAEDYRQRAIFLSDDTVPTVMCWYDAHQQHAEEPYLGCPFCQDEFVPRTALEAEYQRGYDDGKDDHMPVWSQPS